MGSLPSPSPTATTPAESIDEEILSDLFHSQQDHINYFFRRLDLSQVLSFTRALLSSPGTIFFSGVGKSGFVARKISTTLVSLGVPSSFLSPLDALHGDIGALSSRDVLVLLSKSGSSEELLRLAPFARDRGAMLVSVTSSQGSLLDQCCDLSVFLPLKRELCPFNLAPVTSAAIQMVFGDTVAVALMRARNLTKEVYATNHPAGRIGKSLVFKVSPFYPCLILWPLLMDHLNGWVFRIRENQN